MIKSKAFGFDRYGDVDVLREKEIELELTEKKDVLIKTEHISVNPVEINIRKGNMSKSQAPKNFRVLGNELQGEIVELLENDSDLSVGDKVVAIIPSGADSEFVATANSRVFKVPDNMPLNIAASFPMIATTAYWTLDPYFYHLEKGDTLAIVGASGNVGSLILQLAREKDIRILAVGSSKNRTYLEKLGADMTIDYRNEEDVKTYQKQADYVINASLFNQGEDLAVSLVKENGTYLGLNALPKLEERPDITAHLMNKTKDMTDQKAMPILFDFYEKHGLELKVAYELPFTLDGLKEAHRLFEGEKKAGKIILKR